MKIAFNVGTAEKHNVHFAWGQFFGASCIRVDGDVLFRGRPVAIEEVKTLSDPFRYIFEIISTRRIPWERIRSWDFEVGQAERHYIRIQKKRPMLLAGFRPSTYRVYVDGDLIAERHGY